MYYLLAVVLGMIGGYLVTEHFHLQNLQALEAKLKVYEQSTLQDARLVIAAVRKHLHL